MAKYIVIFGVLIILGAGFFLIFKPNYSPIPYSTPTPIATAAPIKINETDTLKSEILQLLSLKYPASAQKMSVNISEVSGDYAKGSVDFTGEGGGLWFAAKANNNWQLVFDGNGIITCESLSDFPDFPTSLIPECYDDKSQTLLKR